MQKVSVNNLRMGMTTHNQLRAADGRVLLGSNIQLNEQYIKRIQELGIHSLSVVNPIIERIGLVYEETLSEEKKCDAMKMLKSAFDEAKKGGIIDVDKISALAKMIGQAVSKNQIVRLNSASIKQDHIYVHSVNVAVLTAVAAGDLDYNATKTHELVMGALLHDIGKVIAGDKAKGPEHCQQGFDYVRKLRGFSTVSAHVVLDHHEKYDGTGFPRKQAGDQIHQFAKITAVVDAYDNMVSGHGQKKPLLPHEAYEVLMSMSDTYFDREIVHAFLAKVPLYPVGSFVVMDSGQIGVITQVSPKLQARPTVVTITDANEEFNDEWDEINLAENLTTFIARVMSEEEVIALTNNFEKSR